MSFSLKLPKKALNVILKLCIPSNLHELSISSQERKRQRGHPIYCTLGISVVAHIWFAHINLEKEGELFQATRV